MAFHALPNLVFTQFVNLPCLSLAKLSLFRDSLVDKIDYSRINDGNLCQQMMMTLISSQNKHAEKQYLESPSLVFSKHWHSHKSCQETPNPSFVTPVFRDEDTDGDTGQQNIQFLVLWLGRLLWGADDDRDHESTSLTEFKTWLTQPE